MSSTSCPASSPLEPRLGSSEVSPGGGFGGRSDVDVVVRNLSPEAALIIERSVADASGVEVEILDFSSLPEAFRSRVLAEGMFVRGP